MATNHRRNGLSNSSGEGRDKDEFLVFGYACKIFRDDPKALYIDQGKHLIPWMGDENLKIDRYDARGTLHNLQACEAPSGGFHRFDGLTSEERRIEELCDEERYAALYNDELEQEAKREEEIKRLHQELSNEASYRQVGFSYDEDSNPVHGPEPPPIEQEIPDEPENPFVPPAALAVPPDLTLPTNQKLALIIARTAQFIVNQGSQMEVVIKFKQAHNPNFGFLSFDHALHPYYKHVMQAIKEGRYTPPKEGEESSQDQEENEEEDEENEDSDDDHYLHPSLAGGVSSQPNQISSVLYKLPADSSYLLLAAQLKEKVASLAPPPAPPAQPEPCQQIGQSVPTPPPTVEAFIDKMACYVAKNGEGFEDIVKAKGDPRFGFLNSSDPFHAYYLQKLEQYGKPHSQAKVSFSIKSKSEVPKTLDKSALQADDDSDEEAQEKNRQEREKAIDDLIEDMVHDQNGKEAEEEDDDIAPPGDENGLVAPVSPVLVLTPTRTLQKPESAATDLQPVKKEEDEAEVTIVSKEPSHDENRAKKKDEEDNSDVEIVGEAKKGERRSERRSAERHRKDRDSSRKEKKSRSHKHSKKSHKRKRSRSRSRSKSRSRARSVSRSRSYSRSSSRERRRRRRKDEEERYRRERERSRERRRRHREQREREERELERQRKKHRRRRSKSRSRSRSRSLSRSPKKSRHSRRYSSSVSRSPSVDPDLPSKRAAIEEKWDILRKKAEQRKGEGRIVSGDSPVGSPLSQLGSSQVGLDNSSSGSSENSLPPALQQPVVAKLAEGLLAKVRAKVFGGSNSTSPIPPYVSK